MSGKVILLKRINDAHINSYALTRGAVVGLPIVCLYFEWFWSTMSNAGVISHSYKCSIMELNTLQPVIYKKKKHTVIYRSLGNETWGRCGMFSHSHREEIWVPRATPACKTLSHCLTLTQAELSEKNKWRHWFTSCLFTALSGEEINSPVEALFPHHMTQRDAWEEGWAGHTHTHTRKNTYKCKRACTNTRAGVLHLD